MTDDQRTRDNDTEDAATQAGGNEPVEKASCEAAGTTSEGGDVEALSAALAEARSTIDALQRQAAELDNRRKRVERIAEESSKYALQDVALELLPVIDNFERALDHAEGSSDARALHDGLKLVHDQLLTVLRKFKVEKIDALGEPFDPNHHEAVGQLESAEHPDHTVIDVHQEGYMLHDRLIRPSRVIVSRAPKAGAAGDDEAED